VGSEIIVVWAIPRICDWVWQWVLFWMLACIGRGAFTGCIKLKNEPIAGGLKAKAKFYD
jgi:hypothetical protein